MGIENNHVEPSQPENISPSKGDFIPSPPANRETLKFDEHGNLTPLDQATSTPEENLPPFSHNAPDKSLSLSSPDAELKNTNQEQEALRYQFEQASRLGRSFLSESRKRSDQILTPYLDTKAFNRGSISAVSKKEQVSPPDIAAAEKASLAICLQAADQIVNARLPKPRAEHALKRRVLEDESASLQNLDRLLGQGFHLAKRMIKENRAAELTQEVRQIWAFQRKTTPDKIQANDRQLLQWVENTIQTAGHHVRTHRTQANELLRRR